MRRTRLISISQTASIEEGGGRTRDNRDAGKTFVVTEVSAIEAEEWGLRALMALGTSGIQVPEEISKLGLMGVALVGYQTLMGAREDAVLPLWREMIPACVMLQQGDDGVGGRILMPWDRSLVEEVSTLLKLRECIMELHTGFTSAEIAEKLRTATLAQMLSNSSTTQTSPESSVA